tara:strand:- start:283 stop:687 length:405 start_codon:yes stop_codon:yes gene_type:complete
MFNATSYLDFVRGQQLATADESHPFGSDIYEDGELPTELSEVNATDTRILEVMMSEAVISVPDIILPAPLTTPRYVVIASRTASVRTHIKYHIKYIMECIDSEMERAADGNVFSEGSYKRISESLLHIYDIVES